VVLPVAPTVEKAGTFVTWEGRPRPFGQVLAGGHALPDVRVLAGIAEEMPAAAKPTTARTPRGLGLRTVEQARAELAEVWFWDGERAPAPAVEPVPAPVPGDGQAVLDTSKLLIDDGRMLDGEPYLRATARPATIRLSAATLGRLGVVEGDPVTLRTDAGAVTLPAETADIPDGVVWTPQHSGAVPLRVALGAGTGSLVSVTVGGLAGGELSIQGGPA
jgi:NADH-quinone oxidoreductase subunit G